MNETKLIPLPRDARIQRYCDRILEGLEGWQAYKQAFPDCKTKGSAHTGHKRSKGRPDVRRYLHAIRQRQATAAVLSLIHKREFLYRIVTTPLTSIDLDSPTRKDHDLLKKFRRNSTEAGESLEMEKLDALKAIDLDNKLAGDNPASNALADFAALIGSFGNATLPGEDRM
jgi:hypothetical protein